MIISIKQTTYQRAQQFTNNIVFAEVGVLLLAFFRNNKNMNFRQFIHNSDPNAQQLQNWKNTIKA